MIGPSQAVQRARADFVRASSASGPVLIACEPGLDAPGVARALHAASAKTDALYAVDCRTHAAERLDILTASHGDGATLLLLDLDELPRPAQVELARWLRDGRRDLWMIATAGNPDQAVSDGKLRRDVYGRFESRIDVPALRHRRADIPMLTGCLVGDAAAATGMPVPTFSREALTLLAALPWRRNLEELGDVVDGLVRGAVGGTVRVEDVLDQIPVEPVAEGPVLEGSLREARLRFERHYIASVLSRHRGRMADAARMLGMRRTNLYRKVRQLGIQVTRAR